VEDGLLDKGGKGRLREAVEVVKLSDIGEALSDPVEWLTTYEYDLLNNIVRTKDSQDNQRTYQYDGLSRKILLNDPTGDAWSTHTTTRGI